MTIRVLLVDDEPLVRSGLRAVLSSHDDIVVVGEAGDGSEVPDLVTRWSPTVVLMDVRMPHVDGIAATRRLVSMPEPPKVLVVTTFENDEHVFDALRAGASGFLLKRSEPEQIVQAVRTVAVGDALLFPSAIRRLVRSYGTKQATVPARRLSEREQDVLRLMARGRSNAEIAGELFITLETVKTHVSAILAKLGARDRTQAVITAYETGFVFAPR